MIPIVSTSKISKSLQICLDTLVFLSIYRNDSLIHSLNNAFVISEPVVEIDFKQEMSISDVMPDVYLLDLDNIELGDFIEAFYKKRFFNPRAKYLIAGSEIPPQASALLAKRYILNVVFLNKIPEKLYTFFPYSSRMLNQIDTKWVEIGNCSILTSLKENNSIVLFPDKIPKVWTNSSISTTHPIAPPYWICTNCSKKGYEADFHHLAFFYFNITENLTILEMFDADWEKENIKNLQEKKFDLVNGESTYLDLDNTYPNAQFFWTLVVPTPEEMPRWKYILTLFSMQVWIIWAISCVCLYLVSVLLDVVNRRFNSSTFLEKAVLIFNLSIGQSYNLSPKVLSEGFLFVTITFFTTIMSFLYTGRFPFFLVGINYEKTISTLEDVMNEKLIIGTTRDALTKDYFAKSDELRDFYEKHNIWCDYTTDCLDQLIAGRNMSFFITSPQLDYWQQFYLDDLGRSLFDRIQPPYLKEQFGSILTKGHPITKRLSMFILHLDQHGIKDYIISKYEKKVLKHTDNLQTKSLTIQYIIAPLFIWIVGVICSLIIFSCERFNSESSYP